ncbi:MAG: hypothetical protein SGJ13_09495 [Actinomycetota bacterium]|nr:hypothetical protein [Actinomycetota bacterium]
MVDTQTLDEATRLLEQAAAIVALALGAWFALGALACAATRVRPQLRVAGHLARWSPAVVRRLAGVACSASVVLAPQVAHAADRPPVAVVVADEPVVRAPHAEPTPAPTAPPVPVPAARTHVVQSGENLWQIARAELGATADTQAVTRYWHAVIDANRTTLRSGNPSLIFPGEAVVLPPSGG